MTPSKPYHLLRGGSWAVDANGAVLSKHRVTDPAWSRDSVTGFRTTLAGRQPR